MKKTLFFSFFCPFLSSFVYFYNTLLTFYLLLLLFVYFHIYCALYYVTYFTFFFLSFGGTKSFKVAMDDQNKKKSNFLSKLSFFKTLDSSGGIVEQKASATSPSQNSGRGSKGVHPQDSDGRRPSLANINIKEKRSMWLKAAESSLSPQNTKSRQVKAMSFDQRDITHRDEMPAEVSVETPIKTSKLKFQSAKPAKPAKPAQPTGSEKRKNVEKPIEAEETTQPDYPVEPEKENNGAIKIGKPFQEVEDMDQAGNANGEAELPISVQAQAHILLRSASVPCKPCKVEI